MDMDGHGLNRPRFCIVNLIRDPQSDAFRVLPYYGGRFLGGELAFPPYESNLGLSESRDDSSTPTHHGGPPPTDYYTATADYATFGLGTFQRSVGAASGLVQNTIPLDFTTSPIAYHHSRDNSYSFSSTEAPGNSSGNVSPVVPCNSLSSTPASTPASYFATADPHSELPHLYAPRAPAEQPGSPTPGMDPIPSLSSAGSSMTETPAQPASNAATFTSTMPGDAATIYCTASGPQLRKPKHRKSLQTSASTVPSINMSPIAGTSTGISLELTPGRLRARLKHKRVEKQYRNRLSAQFERLLSVLPADRFHNSDDGDAANAGEYGEDSRSADWLARIDGKTVTRAEVLDVAARFIEELQLQ